MNWNVQHANPARSRQQAGWIAGQPIDVAVLTEVSASHGATALIQELTDYGFTVCCPTGPGSDYRVLIASRIGKLESCPQIQTTHLPHRCVATRLHLNHDDATPQTVGIVGLYVPSRGNRERRNVDKRAFQNAVTRLIRRLPALIGVNGPVLITGDLNVVEPDHQPTLKVFGAWEYDFYRAFSAAGYTDAYRHLHPHQPDHSWYGRSGAGYRIDHAFCSSEHVVQSCEYDQRPRRNRLSDHAAMTLVLQWRY
ncbi:endonuclease/exonuclease/phosphatase family protein [Actinomadura darangshiensis]|nr:endonuclease/exonuclease/phosphatase family protein [Actinomadura darangshiensis]